MEEILKRDRWIIGGGLLAITGVAWWYMAYEARVMVNTGVCQCLGIQLSGPDWKSWSSWQVFGVFVMWAEMMVAMMLPTAAPMILTFSAVYRRRRATSGPYVPTSLFVLGYLAVWTGFSAVATLAQWYLHERALLSSMMTSSSPWLAGSLLVATGFFQWTPWKRACLTHCRTPLSFIMTEWREGAWGAFTMGLKHGAFCAGCCWFLMGLLFVAGVMNIFWIAVITLLVVLEKLAPRGLELGRLLGFMFLIWGSAVLAVAVL